MAKSKQGKHKLPSRTTAKKAASYRRATPAISKKTPVSGRFLSLGAIRKRTEERSKTMVATQPPPPKEFASAGMIDDSELQSTNIKKYIRGRLGDRS